MGTVLDSAAPREAPAAHSLLWPRLFEYWHLLSLDAPTVAALWASFFARAMHISLPWHAPLLLAIGTWLIYAADRILDGSRRHLVAPLQERHRFHARHRKVFLGAAAAAIGVLLWLIRTRMTPSARYEDTVLFTAALVYFLIVHYPGPATKRWLPKELAVGIVFAAATAVPAWSRLIFGRAELFPAVAIFAALCWLNCVAIERWESAPPMTKLQSTTMHRSTLWAANHFLLATMMLAALSGILTMSLGLRSLATFTIYLAVLVAACCLACIDRYRDRLSSIQLRIAADAALIVPIVFLPFMN